MASGFAPAAKFGMHARGPPLARLLRGPRLGQSWNAFNLLTLRQPRSLDFNAAFKVFVDSIRMGGQSDIYFVKFTSWPLKVTWRRGKKNGGGSCLKNTQNFSSKAIG